MKSSSDKRKRFSRATVLADLESLIEIADRGYDPKNGWAQVRGKGEEANRLYSEWRTFNLVYSMIKNGEIG